MTVIPKAFGPLLNRLHDEWRDRILTALTLLMVVHLFIVAPLESHSHHIQPVGAVFVVLLSIGLLILSRSLVPVMGILAVVGLLAVAVVLRIRGGHVALDVSLQASACSPSPWCCASAAAMSPSMSPCRRRPGC
jgi:di/tricarboxylate transporter